jgi:hypothetical protein
MKLKKLLFATALPVLTAISAVVMLFPQTASASAATLCNGAARLNRPGCYGYFSGTYYYGSHGIQGQNIIDCTKAPFTCVNGESVSNAIPDWVDTADEFINFIGGYLQVGSGAGYDYNKAGAAFIIDTMLGRWGTDFGNTTNGIAYAQAHFDQWATAVRGYEAQGRIGWNVATTLPVGTVNSLHACWPSIPDCEPYNISSYDSGDFAFFVNPDAEDSHVLTFYNPDGSTFQIRRECANVLGQVAPLTLYDWRLSGQSTASTPSIYANESVTFTNQVKNTGSAPANFSWSVGYCFDACSGYTTLTGGGDSNLPANGVWRTENAWTYSPPHSTTNYRICEWIAFSDATGVGTGWSESPHVCVTIKPLTASCTSLVINPTLVGTTDGYTVTATVSTNGGKAGAQTTDNDSNFFINVNGPGVSSNNPNVTPVTVGGSPSSSGLGTLTATLNQPATNNAGTYTVTYGIAGAVAPITCSGTFDVSYRPYFSVLGGDVTAGAGFGGSCTEVVADLKSWNFNTGGTPNYYGGGSAIGAWATGNISNFVSGMGLTGGAASNNGYGLSFANTSNTSGGGYGGNFGTGSVPCLYDAYGNKPGGLSPPPGAGTIGSISGSGTYSGIGNYTLGSGGDLTVGQDGSGQGIQYTVYIQGNLYIRNNVKYSYSNIVGIPRVNFYVKGNIYIDPNVTELHGVYVAQKTSGASGGYITTCATGFGATIQPYATCNKQLTFVGAAEAENGMYLNRTYGNLAAAPGVTNQPAEVFQYSPELWMSASSGSGFKYQAYTSLPPVL